MKIKVSKSSAVCAYINFRIFFFFFGKTNFAAVNYSNIIVEIVKSTSPNARECEGLINFRYLFIIGKDYDPEGQSRSIRGRYPGSLALFLYSFISIVFVEAEGIPRNQCSVLKTGRFDAPIPFRPSAMQNGSWMKSHGAGENAIRRADSSTRGYSRQRANQ